MRSEAAPATVETSDPIGAVDARGLLRDGVLLEWYRYPPGPAVALPTHSHEQYQLNLNVGTPAGVHYRGAHHVVPPGQLTVIMPGEPHTPRDPEARDQLSAHLTLYVDAELIARASAAAAASARYRGLPFFRDPVVGDTELIGRFARLHALLTGPSVALSRDVGLLTVLNGLVVRHAGVRAVAPLRSTHRAVRRAREYLHEHHAANVSLSELARASELSPYHLTRLFTAGIGMPPHAYLIHLRIDHAKRLLAAGEARSVSDVAHDVGFFDLSHLTRHFKRHVGVSPGVYARRASRRRPSRSQERRKLVHPPGAAGS
jgi:AraC-like DNA-binding protein